MIAWPIALPWKLATARLKLGEDTFEKQPEGKPAPSPGAYWDDLIGEYGWDHDVLYILERNGKLHALIEWFFDYPLEEDGPDRFRFPNFGLYSDESVIFRRDVRGKVKEAEAASVVFARRKLDGEDGYVFRITPVRAVKDLAAEADRANPPAEPGEFLKPDLVELTAIEPSIKLDIRYATANNFLSVPVYKTASAYTQRPAALALMRAHQAPRERGLWPVDSRRLSALAGDEDILGRGPRIGQDIRRRSVQRIKT